MDWCLAHVNLGHGPCLLTLVVKSFLTLSSSSRERMIISQEETAQLLLCQVDTGATYMPGYCRNSTWTLPRTGQDGKQGKWEQNAKQTAASWGTRKTHHTRTLLIIRGPTTSQEPQKLWAKGAMKDLEGIRDTETSVAPDSVLSLPISVQEKQGSKWK